MKNNGPVLHRERYAALVGQSKDQRASDTVVLGTHAEADRIELELPKLE